MYSRDEIVTELQRRVAAFGMNHGERWDELLTLIDDFESEQFLAKDCQHEMLNATSRECLCCGEVVADDIEDGKV